MSKTIQEQIEIMTHFANGGMIEIYKDGLWSDITNLDFKGWNFAIYDFRKKEYKYPIFFKSKSGTIFRYDSLDTSVCLKNGVDCDWVLGGSCHIEHTKLPKDWVQFEYKEQNKKITIERWLIKNGERFDVGETSSIKDYMESCIGWRKVKLLDSYEVEL